MLKHVTRHKNPHRRVVVFFVVVVAAVVAVFGGGACVAAQVAADRQGLAENAAAMVADPRSPPADALRAFLAADDLVADSAPVVDAADVAVDALTTWRLADDVAPIQERLRFSSAIRPQAGPHNTAVAYAYRRGAWGERPVILWLPGARVSDFAFRFLRRFFDDAIGAGFDVVVWVPPHHLERQAVGQGDGDGLFGVDLKENLHIDRQMVREVRTLRRFLAAKGVQRVGLWGGSLGASVAWLAASVEPVDHVALMIPIVDWRTMVLLPPEMKPLVARLESLGVDDDLRQRAMLAASPISFRAQVPAGRTLLLYARHDQLTPEDTTTAFAADNGIVDVVGYERSHASILLTDDVYVRTALFFARMAAPPSSP
jgi:pimeloyl-ACP methyl ester carboxylesterase